MGKKRLESELQKLNNPQKAKILSNFFKTGKGEYGEGDIFFGLSVPTMRRIVSKYVDLSLKDLEELLTNPVHECRFVALIILISKFKKASELEKEGIVNLYLRNTKSINNWDLVDCSAGDILGEYLLNKSKAVLYKLAKSDNLWENRISIIATKSFIKREDYKDTLRLSEILMQHKHDLIHKAVGWMLREVGKQDRKVEENFLLKHHKTMPRTMLRYAIEKFEPEKRNFFLVRANHI